MSDESVAGDAYGATRKKAVQPRLYEWGRAAALAVLWVWRHRPSFFRSFDDARRQTVNVFILLVGVLLVVVVVKATFFEKTPVIEPIAIPKSLEEIGYSGTIVAQRLIDGAHEIGEQARTSKERVRFGSDSKFATLSAIQLPSSDLTVRSLVAALRDLLGIDGGRISGEITIRRHGNSLMPTKYALLLRIDRLPHRTSSTFESDDLEELIKVSSQAIVAEFDPYILASYFFAAEAWTQMEEVVDRLVASQDKETVKWALNLRGLSFKRRNEHDESIRAFEQATRIDEKFAPALANWGNALAAKRDYQGAVAKYEKAIEADRNYPGGYNSWGAMLARTGDVDGAIEKYRKAMEVDPKYSSALFNWGIALIRNDDLEGALAKFQWAVAVDPKYPYGHYGWGFVLMRRKNYDASMERLERAVQLSPRSPTFQHIVGKVLHLKGDYDGAIQRYQRSIELDDKFAECHVDWGDTLAARREYAGAFEQYRRAMTLMPERAAALSPKAHRVAVFRDAGTVP